MAVRGQPTAALEQRGGHTTLAVLVSAASEARLNEKEAFMGWHKEQMLVQEEQARSWAIRHGYTCACTEPLLTAEERRNRYCSRCWHNLNKDD